MTKVYWSARNLYAWWNPFGNHHFVLIMIKERIDSIAPIYHKNEGFMTLGAFNVNGYLTFQANNTADVQSVRDVIDRLGWVDLQRHRVGTPYGTELGFARVLVGRALCFEQNTKHTPVPFTLFGDNCAAWVNTLFKAAEVPANERRHAGQFQGIDAGERLKLPEDLFFPRWSTVPPINPGLPAPPPPVNGYRIHKVKSGDWLSKIAITYYGDMNKWPVIYTANKDKISDPNRIEVGQELVIP